jgi:hypothetical protein
MDDVGGLGVDDFDFDFDGDDGTEREGYFFLEAHIGIRKRDFGRL